MEAWPPTLHADENSLANFTISVGYGAFFSSNQVMTERKIYYKRPTLLLLSSCSAPTPSLISLYNVHIGKAGFCFYTERRKTKEKVGIMLC